MTLHKKSILVIFALITVASIWAVSAANGALDQKSVLAGKVLSQGLVTAGQAVREGQALVLIESLTGPAPAVRATTDGKVREVLVKPGEVIRTGDVVVRIDPAGK